MDPQTPTLPPRPPSEPVELVPAGRSDRAVLENLGQLYRYDLSESYGLLPNPDGTFNNRRLDLFRGKADPEDRAWLIKVADGLGGFVMSRPIGDAMTISDFFVVRALRRTGVGRAAARLAIGQGARPVADRIPALQPGRRALLVPGGHRGGRRRVDDAGRSAGRGTATRHLDRLRDALIRRPPPPRQAEDAAQASQAG